MENGEVAVDVKLTFRRTFFDLMRHERWDVPNNVKH